MKKFDFIGQTDEKGQFKIYNRSFMDEFFKKNPGKRFAGHIEIEKEDISDPLRAYYFAVVVHHWQMILKNIGYSYSLAGTHEYIKQFSTMTVEEQVLKLPDGNTEFVTIRFKSLTELSQKEMSEYIEDLKRIAAEQFDHFIPDPVTI